MTKKEKILYIINEFEKRFSNAKISLNYETEYQLLVATVLSAQCTDKRVNTITEKLFEKVKYPCDIYYMDILELEKYIKSAGFYHEKARNLKLGAKTLVEDYGGVLPKSMDELTKLGGVGRKTANVLLHELWNISEGIVVDTHVKKLSNLLGLTDSKNPLVIENTLKEIVPKKYWKIISHYMILHGRLRCISKNLECKICDLIRETK